jgi:hypothetical protein
MFARYRNFQNVQRQWIRQHPVQYVVINATLIVVWVGYMEYKDRKEKREFQNTLPPQDN